MLNLALNPFSALLYGVLGFFHTFLLEQTRHDRETPNRIWLASLLCGLSATVSRDLKDCAFIILLYASFLSDFYKFEVRDFYFPAFTLIFSGSRFVSVGIFLGLFYLYEKQIGDRFCGVGDISMFLLVYSFYGVQFLLSFLIRVCLAALVYVLLMRVSRGVRSREIGIPMVALMALCSPFAILSEYL